MDPLQVEQALGYLQEISQWLEGMMAVLVFIACLKLLK